MQVVTDKYCAACLATKLARDNGLRKKYPWRRKRNYPTTWKADGFKLTGTRLKLSLGMFAGKRQKPIEVKLSKSTLKTLEGVKLQQISLIWDGWLKLAIVIDDVKESACGVQSNAQIKDLNHKITRSFVTWAIENKIAKVYVGNPEGVQRKKRRRVVSQKLSRWSFGKHMKYLEYKFTAVGIVLEKISEAYSTQTCPQCGRRHKCNSRNYRCSCGYIAHRDIHGARNILSLALNGRICITTPIKEQKYLRTA